MKTLVIGDIHGCYGELLDLLDKAGLSGDDSIIALGDIIDRGPETPEVLAFFKRQPNTRSIMGNHERKHIRWSKGEVQPALSQQISKEQLGPAYPIALEFMGTLPTYLELPEAVLVHGGMEPGLPLAEQKMEVLCGVRSGEHYLEEHYYRPWYELYQGEKPVIFGHQDFLKNGHPFVYQGYVFGLDTSCVHGSRLTGLLLPDFTFVSVPSRENHWSQIKQSFRSANPKAVENKPSPFAIPWDTAAEQTLAVLLVYVQQENERVLADLRGNPEFAGLLPRQQAKAYAAVVRGSPIERLLHLARGGKLNAETARRAVGDPQQIRTLADRTLKRAVDQE